MINTDAYYEIGAGHTFCQDYADHGTFGAKGKLFRYAIVCDGCSGSKGSDIGARLLAKWFPRAFQNAYEVPERLQEIVAAELIAQIKKNELDIAPESYDATLVAIVYDTVEDTLYSFAWGDGKIFQKGRDDNGYLTDIVFKSNAPYYLSYKSDPERDLRYEAHFGDKYAEVSSNIVRDDKVIVLEQETKFKQKSFFQKFEKVSTIISHASVFTDGIDTFHLKNDADIQMPPHNIYNQLTQYKGVHGEFVQRRMNAVKKFCQKEGWQHFDDISVATITF